MHDKGRTWSHCIKRLGCGALHLFNQIRVERELKDRAASGLSSQLRVVRLIGPITKSTGCGNLSKDVRLSEPAIRTKNSLDDNIYAITHRLQRLRVPLVCFEIVQIENLQPFVSKRLDITMLVFSTAISEQFDDRVDPHRRLELAFRDRHVQARPVATAKGIR